MASEGLRKIDANSTTGIGIDTYMDLGSSEPQQYPECYLACQLLLSVVKAEAPCSYRHLGITHFLLVFLSPSKYFINEPLY